MTDIVLVAHNLRSTHNVGSLLRTAEGLGATQVYLTGYTPHPPYDGDTRLPHLSLKIGRQIAKTALGASEMVTWSHAENVAIIIENLKSDGYIIAAIEQSDDSVALPDFETPHKIALLVGREVEGVEPEILALCDMVLEIPMFGQKESFNVVQAAAMALYHCRFSDGSR